MWCAMRQIENVLRSVTSHLKIDYSLKPERKTSKGKTGWSPNAGYQKVLIKQGFEDSCKIDDIQS